MHRFCLSHVILKSLSRRRADHIALIIPQIHALHLQVERMISRDITRIGTSSMIALFRWGFHDADRTHDQIQIRLKLPWTPLLHYFIFNSLGWIGHPP